MVTLKSWLGENKLSAQQMLCSAKWKIHEVLLLRFSWWSKQEHPPRAPIDTFIVKCPDPGFCQLGLPQAMVELDSEGASSWCAKASERPGARGGYLDGEEGKGETNKFSQATEVCQPDFLCCAVGVSVVYYYVSWVWTFSCSWMLRAVPALVSHGIWLHAAAFHWAWISFLSFFAGCWFSWNL